MRLVVSERDNKCKIKILIVTQINVEWKDEI